MTRLSEFQVNEFCDTLIALCRKQGAKGEEKLYAAEILVKRFKTAYRRDQSGSAIPDGYPRGGSGGGSPGLPRRTVEADAHGGEESVEFTSVELAYLEREHQSKSNKDHHHDLVLNAIEALGRLIKAKDDLEHDLARIENLIDMNPDMPPSGDPGCWAMARIKSWEPVLAHTEVPYGSGRFYDLGRWAYDFARRTNRVPSEDECRLHRDGKKVRVKVDDVSVTVG